MPKRRDYQKEAAIQNATLHLVIRTGFAGLKMADVAKEAQMATGTLYLYYKSKEELINELFVLTKREVAAAISDQKHAAPSFFETFRNMWYGYFEFCLQNPEKMLFVEQFLYSGYIAEEIKQQTEAYFDDLNIFLKEAQAQHFVREGNIELIKAQMQGAVHEIIKTHLQKKIILDDTLIRQCFEMAWDSVRR